MNSKDNAIEKTELIINALAYAHEHKLDITKKDDVKKILEAVNIQETDDEEFEIFMKLLQDADTFMEMTASKKLNKKTNLPN